VKLFRINIYLKIRFYILSFFLRNKDVEKFISKQINKTSNKTYFILTSQLRVSFLILLKYLKLKFPKKNEIILSPYNLPEMINVAKNLKYKIKFCDINYKSGFFEIKKLKKIINNKTSSIVTTNMFNTFDDSMSIRKICKSRKIILIEDNAIYFDNYKMKKNVKKYSGGFGKYSLYSFNIMKNISALYGGGVSTNDKEFNIFAKNELNKYSTFPIQLIIKQSVIFIILKFLSIRILYKIFFFNIVKYAHFNKNLFLLKIFYPSLKFKQIKFPEYYFAKISNISKKLIYLQLNDSKSRTSNHNIRKINNNYYSRKFKEKNIEQVRLINIKDSNFQNFIDYPILVKKKNLLNKFLLSNGAELRIIYYKNCGKIFNNDKSYFPVSEKYENEIICLPNHRNINTKYIDFIINLISDFYRKNV